MFPRHSRDPCLHVTPSGSDWFILKQVRAESALSERQPLVGRGRQAREDVVMIYGVSSLADVLHVKVDLVDDPVRLENLCEVSSRAEDPSKPPTDVFEYALTDTL
jgi:hypothetical protein